MSYSEQELYRMFDEYIDETHPGGVTVMGCYWRASRVLAEMDVTGYETYFSNWLDGQVTDGTIVEIDGTYYDPVEICSDCNNPLDDCTCETEDEEE